MAVLVIPLTIIALLGLGYIIVYGMFLKEKERDEETDETDDYRDEELNSIYDDYGRNDYI